MFEDAEGGSLSWDAGGNLKANTGRGITNITYDSRNLPLSMQLEDGLHTVYRYNAGGWRTHKQVVDGGTTSLEECYILDGGTTLAVTDAGGNVKHWNLYGNGLIGRQESEGTKRYYLTDHLGSTRQVIDGSGTALEYYDYYPFGLVLRSNVAGQETKETFTGKEQDPATGYYYFGARYYDAALGNWGATDPAGQFASPYVYAGNPVSFVDPDGEFALTSAVVLGFKIASAAMAAHSVYQGFSEGRLAGGIHALMTTGASYMVSYGLGASGLFNYGNSFTGTIATGTVQGAIGGGTVSSMFGGSFGNGAIQGGLSGGASAGAKWLTLRGALAIDASIASKSVNQGADFSSDEAIHNVAKDEFNAEIGKNGLSKLTGQEVPQGYELSSNESFMKERSILERFFGIEGGRKGGVTQYLGNRQSAVFISPRATTNFRSLYMTLGHELVHVRHYHLGLRERDGDYFSSRSEYAAYNWNVNAARSRGWYRYMNGYQNHINKNYSLGFYHKDYYWNKWY